MKAALYLAALSIVLSAAEPRSSAQEPVEKGTAEREMQAHWREIEPSLFAADTAREHIGDWVICGGLPISLTNPVKIKLARGTIIRLTKLQGADRDELASFRKPPSRVFVEGPILAIDRVTRTVTIKAVSTMFGQ